jgi:hypothetical protein
MAAGSIASAGCSRMSAASGRCSRKFRRWRLDKFGDAAEAEPPYFIGILDLARPPRH